MRVPSLLLFDMDDVLCTYSRHARAEHLARLAGTTAENILRAIWASGFEAQSDAGILSPQAYLQGFGERIGYPLTLDEWVEARRAGMAPRMDVLDLAHRARRRTRVAVLTNNTMLVVENAARLFPELLPIFGRDLYASAGFQAAKPQAACYRRCLASLDVTPEETLFVDDRTENVVGAKAAGLHAHQYTSPMVLHRLLHDHALL